MNPDALLFRARLIALSMLFGVLAFAGVGVWMAGEGSIEPVDPGLARVAVAVWGAVALGCVAGWYVFRGKALERLTPPRARWDAAPEKALGALVVAWALAEAIGIAGVVVTLLTGRMTTLVGGVLGTAIAIALSWPRPEWFPVSRRGTRAETEQGGEPWGSGG